MTDHEMIIWPNGQAGCDRDLVPRGTEREVIGFRPRCPDLNEVSSSTTPGITPALLADLLLSSLRACAGADSALGHPRAAGQGRRRDVVPLIDQIGRAPDLLG
jgi:hypothetical protein